MQNDQQAARKAAVYEAALQLIGQGVSPAALKIQQLADAAGIGKGTVYEYFSSKEEIFAGLGRVLLCPGKRACPCHVRRLYDAGRAGRTHYRLFTGHCRQPDGQLQDDCRDAGNAPQDGCYARLHGRTERNRK